MLWCTVPVWLACLWFVAEIVLSLLRVRRVLLDEERRRKLSVRRVRRRTQRKISSRAAAAAAAAGQGQRSREPGRIVVQEGAEGGAGAGRLGGAGKEDDGDGDGDGDGVVDGSGADASTPLSLGRPALARAASSRLRRHVSRRLSDPACNPSATAILEQGEEDGEGWFGNDDGIGGSGRGGERQIGTASAPNTPESQPRTAARATISYDGGADDEDDEADYVQTTLFAAPADVKLKSSSLTPGLKPAPAPAGRDPRREVQISFLLQAWLRLWATMAFFAVVLTVFMTLLSLRLFGFQAVSAGCIGSPCILALAVLGLHSLLLLDGSGGVGGGPVMRGGGSRLAVGLGRRPVILLTLVSAVLVVLKVDSAAADTTTTGSLWAVAVLVGKVHWGFVFFPLWVMLFLLEVVYVVSLWENHAGVSLTRSLGVFGGGPKEDGYRGGGGVDGPEHGRGPCCCCLNDDSPRTASWTFESPRWWLLRRWWRRGGRGKGEYERLDADDVGGGGQQQQGARGGSGASGELRRREQHQQHAPSEEEAACLAYSSGGGGGGGARSGGFRRWRVELTPSQRAAASSIAAGLFLLTMTVISVTVGSSREQASWGVPLTFVMAAAGLALVSRTSTASGCISKHIGMSGRVSVAPWISTPCM